MVCAAEDTTTPSTLPLNISTEEAATGRLMFGVGIDPDTGDLLRSIVFDEQNFDWTRFPSSWEDIRNGTAWRGAGQKLRLEAVRGTQLQRYMIDFVEPYLSNTSVSMRLNAYYCDRRYREWFEQRIGGQVTYGYQLSPDLSAKRTYRGTTIKITNPIDPTLPDLAEVAGAI